ncbi:hypothetical protein ACFWOB_35280 [Streptomyces sp. NPDC058420]
MTGPEVDLSMARTADCALVSVRNGSAALVPGELSLPVGETK